MKFNNNWFKNLPKVTTDLPLRQFIPINNEKNIAMVSYSDTYDADYWNNYIRSGKEILNEKILEQLKIMFPKKNITYPEKTYNYFWKDAVHVWLPHNDSTEIKKKISSIDSNLFIVGESFSTRQGWLEGGLETVEDILKNL